MKEITKPTLSLRFAQLGFWLNRFRTLPRVDHLFRSAREGTVLERSFFGFKFLCDVSKHGAPRLIYAEGERFLAEAEIILKLLKPGYRVVDVGANIGYYCLML